MSPNFDVIFDQIHDLRASRSIDLREALTYQLESASVTYAPTFSVDAKVLWKGDAVGLQRGSRSTQGIVWTEIDKASLIIWFRDLTGKPTAASGSEIADWIRRFKGAIYEGSREYYSRWDVDGQALKTRDVFPIERPDGKVYALKVMLQAE